jgi:hypothetical protein
VVPGEHSNSNTSEANTGLSTDQININSQAHIREVHPDVNCEMNLENLDDAIVTVFYSKMRRLEFFLGRYKNRNWTLHFFFKTIIKSKMRRIE